MSQKRDIWVDNIKVFACILVTLGHFAQSMTKSGFVAVSDWTRWFNDTLYFFHVALFFLCSGYLYQKNSCIHDFSSWKNHVLKKVITLGIPYLVFSFATWVMKAMFADSVNTENTGLLQTLFLNPVPPYWYLYVVIFLFAVIPTFRSRKVLLLALGVTVVCRLILCWTGEFSVYLLFQSMEYAVWFVAGMALAAFPVLDRGSRSWKLWLGMGLAARFLTLSLFARSLPGWTFVSVYMGVMGCGATVLIMKAWFSGEKSHRIWAWMARYTMPIFLMHTIFSAGWRVLLMKLGIVNVPVHILTGLIVSFAGPILAAWIMSKIKGLDFIMYPGKYLRLGRKAPAKR